MKEYKKTIKARILLLSIPVLFAAIFGAYNVFLAGHEIKETSVFGFQAGMITSLGLCSIIIVIRYRQLLNDEKKLLLHYNRENDERIKAIKAKAGIPMLPIVSIIVIIAGVIAGYFDTLIFMTLIAVAAFQMTICAIVKVVYMKKM